MGAWSFIKFWFRRKKGKIEMCFEEWEKFTENSNSLTSSEEDQLSAREISYKGRMVAGR